MTSAREHKTAFNVLEQFQYVLGTIAMEESVDQNLQCAASGSN